MSRVEKFDLVGLQKSFYEFRILDKDMVTLERMYQYVMKIWQLERRCFIFCFFERSQSQLLMDVAKDLVRSADEVDDFLTKKLPQMREDWKK